MAELVLDKAKTAVLLADFHADGMGANPLVKERHVIENSRALTEAARRAGVQVIYIVVNFRQGYAEVSDRNQTFKHISAMKKTGQQPPADAVTLIVPELPPQPGDIVVVKHRVSALHGTELDQILKSQGIETLVLLGHSTSGVILSTVLEASDADYQLVVVEDGCADTDQDVHTFLMEQVFSRKATVTTSQEVVKALSAG